MSTEDLVSVERLVRVETKMDVLIGQGEQLRVDHEARLRAAEAAVSELKTKVALVAGSVGTITGTAAAVIAHFIGA